MPFGIKKAIESLLSPGTNQKNKSKAGPSATSSKAKAVKSENKPIIEHKSRSKGPRKPKTYKLISASSKKDSCPPLQRQNLAKILKELECPVCFNTCTPPIYPCENGHMVCSTCRNVLDRCPTCKEEWGHTRNLFAEQFIGQYSQICQYAQQGCPYLKFRGDDLKPHEKKCFYRNLQCPVPACECSIGYKDLYNHLVGTHEIYGHDQIPVLINYYADEPLITNKKWMPYYIKAYGCTFYVMMEIIRPHFWAWIWVHYWDEEQSGRVKFQGTITFVNKDKAISSQWKGPIYNIRTPSSLIIQQGLCFSGPEGHLRNLVTDGLLSIYINIQHIARTISFTPASEIFLNATTLDQNNNPIDKSTKKPSNTRSNIQK